MVVTETERLYLRRLTLDDANALFLLNSVPEILKYLPGSPMKSIEDARQVINEVILPYYNMFDYGRWAVVNKQDERVIGYCGPKYVDKYHEVGLTFRFLPQYWGKGFATEAAMAAMKVCQQYHLTGMIGVVLLGNKAYEKVLHKLGMHEKERNHYLGYRVKIFHRSFHHLR